MKKQPEVRAQTRQKFIDAFLELLKKKDMNQISVGELVKIAGYNRSTFYEYFTDMPDLIHQIEDTFMEQIRQELINVSKNTDHEDEIISGVFRLMFELNEPMYNLLGPHGDPAFFSHIKDMLLPLVGSTIGVSEEDPTYADYIGAYGESALFGFLQHWHEQGKDLPEQELFSLGYNLIKYGIIGTINMKQTYSKKGKTCSPNEETGSPADESCSLEDESCSLDDDSCSLEDESCSLDDESCSRNNETCYSNAGA